MQTRHMCPDTSDMVGQESNENTGTHKPNKAVQWTARTVKRSS